MSGARRPRLGQHFLRSEAVLAAILDAAGLRRGERVLEVGPGRGVLTRPLLDAVGAGGEVVAVEYDAELARALRTDAPPQLRLVRGDAARVDLSAHGPFDAIVSNLPYQISGPVTARFLDLLPVMPWRRAVLLVQKEFAERLIAAPGTGDYGRLSVHVQRWCAVQKVRDVPPGCFDPPPRVDSAVITLTPHASPPFVVAASDETLWRDIVDVPFGTRRKQLRNTLPHAVAPHGIDADAARAALEDLGWSARRPEELSPADVHRLLTRLRGAT